jgi:hypothetical protein
MTKYFIAAVLLASLSAPTFAQAGPFYIMFDKKTNKCVMMTKAPGGFRYKMMGSYPTAKKAHAAMAGMAKCR